MEGATSNKLGCHCHPKFGAGIKSTLWMLKYHFIHWNFCVTMNLFFFFYNIYFLHTKGKGEAEMGLKEKLLIGDGKKKEKEKRRRDNNGQV